MVGMFKVVTLCGSTRFKEEFLDANRRFTLKGYIVLMPGVFGHSGDREALDPEVKAVLDNMHFRKIDLSDEVFVLNVGGYVGESTAREIAYAVSHGRPVRYLEPMEKQ